MRRPGRGRRVTLGPPLDVAAFAPVPVHEGTLTLLFQGEHPGTRLPVAVRRPRPGVPGGARALAAALDAVDRLAGHPAVVPVVAAGGADGDAALVTAWLPRRLTDATLTAREVAEQGAALAGALGALHAAGYVHRDVRAGTVFLDEADRGVLSGLHHAVAADEGVAGCAPGPLHPESAPESLQGAPAAAPADVYGLGAVLHQSLAGAPAVGGVAGEGEAALALRILAHRPVPVAGPGVPPVLADLVLACLHPDPRRRPPAAPLARRLREVAAWIQVDEDRRQATPPRMPQAPRGGPRFVLPVRPQPRDPTGSRTDGAAS